MIVDIENEFGVKKQVDLDTVEFRELSKAKSKNSRTKFMIGLVKATDTLIQLESKKFFDLIEGTNRLFDFISEFYTAIIDYDSLIVKDEKVFDLYLLEKGSVQRLTKNRFRVFCNQEKSILDTRKFDVYLYKRGRVKQYYCE